MENKINIANLLKDCPSGMELDSPLFDDVHFDSIDEVCDAIKCYIQDSHHKIGISFNKYGCYSNISKSKCVIFPKGKTTWEGFIPPCQFKDGDIIAMENECGIHIFIYNYTTDEYNGYGSYVVFTSRGNFKINGFCSGRTYRLATEEEKQKLFDAIKANGYKWNEETKTLEKLPKFKVGDRIRKMGESSTYTITDVNNAHYFCGKYVICDTCDNDWELVPNKFDITTLKPFDKVLIRDSYKNIWCASIFSHIWKDKYVCVSVWYSQCIPYKGNEHLLGTTDDCDEYYKTWE